EGQLARYKGHRNPPRIVLRPAGTDDFLHSSFQPLRSWLISNRRSATSYVFKIISTLAGIPRTPSSRPAR
ncbi:MAG: hypothetical protein ABSG87_04520, partial [Verrucomicrobiota bacterium]